MLGMGLCCFGAGGCILALELLLKLVREWMKSKISNIHENLFYCWSKRVVLLDGPMWQNMGYILPAELCHMSHIWSDWLSISIVCASRMAHRFVMDLCNFLKYCATPPIGTNYFTQCVGSTTPLAVLTLTLPPTLPI